MQETTQGAVDRGRQVRRWISKLRAGGGVEGEVAVIEVGGMARRVTV